MQNASQIIRVAIGIYILSGAGSRTYDAVTRIFKIPSRDRAKIQAKLSPENKLVADDLAEKAARAQAEYALFVASNGAFLASAEV